MKPLTSSSTWLPVHLIQICRSYSIGTPLHDCFAYPKPEYVSIRDLGSCAAACRNWVPRSRSKQFNAVRVSTVDRLPIFLDLVEASNATITPYIQRIELSFEAEPSAYSDNATMKRLTSLYALQAVIFKDGVVSPKSCMVEIMGTTLRSFGSLVSLELADIAFESFIPLQHIVAACHRLERLYITNVNEGEEEEEQTEVDGEKAEADDGDYTFGPSVQDKMVTLPPRYAQFPRLPCAPLQLLCLVACEFSLDLLAWVNVPASCQNLTCICLDFNDTFHNTRVVGGLLRGLGANLKELCFVDWPLIVGQRGMPSFQDMILLKKIIQSSPIAIVFSPEYIDLSYNTRLEVLSFSRCTTSVIRRDCLSLMNQVSSDCLQMLNISFVDPRRDLALELDARRTQLTAIDEYSQHSNLVNYRCLTLGVPAAFANTIKAYFPLSAARGILRVMSVRQMDNLPAIAHTARSFRI